MDDTTRESGSPDLTLYSGYAKGLNQVKFRLLSSLKVEAVLSVNICDWFAEMKYMSVTVDCQFHWAHSGVTCIIIFLLGQSWLPAVLHSPVTKQYGMPLLKLVRC